LLGSVKQKLNLAANKTKPAAIRFASPLTISTGQYYLIAVVDSANAITEQDESNNSAATSSAIQISAPTVDLSPQFGKLPGTIAANSRVALPVQIKSGGNVPAKGAVTVRVYASADQTLDDSDALLASVLRSATIAPGKIKAMSLPLSADTVSSGNYYLLVTVDFSGAVTDSDTTNNTTFSSTPIAVA
jgi:subtilase family serine protease